MNLKSLLYYMAAALIVSGCRESKPVQSSENSMDSVEIMRFDVSMLKYADCDDHTRSMLRDSFSEPISMLFHRDNEELDSVLLRYSRSEGVTVFTPDVMQRIPDLRNLERTAAVIRERGRLMLPSIEWPNLYAVVSTYNQSIMLNDDALLIALNHYLGEDYDGYKNFDKYKLHYKTVEHLPYDLAEAMVLTTYPYRPDSVSAAVNRMLYEGAVVEALMRLVPDGDEAQAIGLTDEQLNWFSNNEADVWSAVVGRELLYSTDTSIEDRLVCPAPFTSVLGADIPGRAGRYLGYRIVSAYLGRHPDASLEYLLSPQFYMSKRSLLMSAYAPR